MAIMHTYHLRPAGGLHVGLRGVGQEETACHVPADTLFAALVATGACSDGTAEPWGRAFVGDGAGPPFLLTSAFPRMGEVRLYPLPAVDLAAYGLGSLADRKRLRRIRFVSEAVFRRIVRGEPLAAIYPTEDNDSGGLFLQDRAIWIAASERERLPTWMRECRDRSGRGGQRPARAFPRLTVWGIDKVPRVAVDRVVQASTIFHTGRLTFAPECGLWFGVVWREPDAPVSGEASWREYFETTLHILGDAGLGGERSYGLGAFSWQAGEEVTWPDPAPGRPAVTLSRYHPRPSEAPAALQGDGVAYRLEAVAGYLASPDSAAQRRRRLWLVGEGSIVNAAGPVMGDVVDVRPRVGDFPHPVWRYGLALPIGMEVPHA